LDKQPNKELSALINLLDEPDENAFDRIREKIFSFGQEAIRFSRKHGKILLKELCRIELKV